MAETVNQEQNAPEAGSEAGEKLFTQAQVNSFFDKRYSEMMSKVSEYEEKAKKFDELQEASKTELQKATEKAEKLQAEITSMKKAAEVRELKDKISADTGVPASLLSGDTEESLKAQAEAIKQYAVSGNAYPALKDGGEVTKKTKLTTSQQFADWMTLKLGG